MTKSRRIVLNTLASYGRAVFAMFVGVFSSRWLLMGLGAEDLGLQCVVGSTISAIIIFETVMQVAVARFYAFAIGKAQTMSEEDGKDEICRWFNVVFLIHLGLPLLILVFGYPLGLYAVRHWLTIPAARMDACVFVFNCSMITTFISMVSTPYIAMYQARQLIVELSVFGVLRTVINFGFTFSLLYVTCDRLEYSGLFGAIVALGILGTQMYRGWRHFPECRVRLPYLADWSRLKQIFVYFFWEIFSCTGNMTRQQGTSIVINKFFGPSVNAAWQIAQTLSNQAMALSGSLMGALVPAVTTEEGAGEREKMIALAFRTCKFGALLILVFSVPLIAEVDEVLRLWLVNPPTFAGELCSCILIAFIIEKLGLGHHVAISAKGKIGVYHTIIGTTFFLSIPIVLALIYCGCGAVSVGYMFIISFALISVERIVLAKYLVEMPIWHYFGRIVFPLAIVSTLSYLAALTVTFLFPPSFWRICLTTAVSLAVMLPLILGFALDRSERACVFSMFKKFCPGLFSEKQNDI